MGEEHPALQTELAKHKEVPTEVTPVEYGFQQDPVTRSVSGYDGVVRWTMELGHTGTPEG